MTRATAAAAPGLVALGAGLALIHFEAGFRTTAWHPAALFLLALLALVTVMAPERLREAPRTVKAALALYAAFTVWTFLSILWADVPGDAWEGANRTLLYGLVLALALQVQWTWAAARSALMLTAGGIAVAALLVLIAAGDGASSFLEGRLAEPAGYANATAALWLIGFWPALHFATERVVSPWIRGAGLGVAVLLIETAVLSQSRGALAGFALTAIVYLLLHTRRWVALAALMLAVAFAAVNWDTLTAVRDATSVNELGASFDDAFRAILVSAIAAALIGFVASLVGGRLIGVAGPTSRRARWGDRALGALALAALAAALVAIGNPSTWIDARWEDFKTTGYSKVESGKTRFTGGLGSNRYDFWRVAWNEFADHPVTGIGADNFAVPYLQQRRTPEAPRYPHSLAFRLLAQLGIVGTALFVAFLGCATAAALGSRRVHRGAGTALWLGGFAGFAYWIAHGLGDWLWEFPALGVLAFGLLGVAMRPATRRPSEEPSAGRRPADGLDSARLPLTDEPDPEPRVGPLIARRAAFAAVGLLAALSLAFPGIAARFVRAAYADYRSDPDVALRRLDRAAKLDFLSADPLLARGIIARRTGRRDVALRALEDAVERSPRSWFGNFELAITLAETGETQKAATYLETAASLNPRQPLIAQIRKILGRKQRVDADAAERALYGQFETKLRPTGAD